MKFSCFELKILSLNYQLILPFSSQAVWGAHYPHPKSSLKFEMPLKIGTMEKWLQTKSGYYSCRWLRPVVKNLKSGSDFPRGSLTLC